MTTAAPTTLAAALFGPARVPRTVLIAVLGALALTISAKVQVPFFPVPITMQTFVVLGLGFVFGSRLGAATVGLYLVQGAAGLPVFAGTPEKGLGLAYMMGPTGGYLLGFLLAAWAVGLLAERGWDRSVPRAALAALLGMALVYAPGLLWLGAVAGWENPILAWGLWPFLPGEALKLALLAVLLPSAWALTARR